MTTIPTYATGINADAQSADCDNGTLGTYTGPAALSANWTANTINLDFYDGETKLSSGTCTYDGGIELPEDPSKTGYEFAGWRVRAAAALPNCNAISDITTCDNTEGCYYDRGWFINTSGCKKGILWSDSGYTSCAEITDQETCESILFADYDNDIDSFCYWNPKTNKCAPVVFGSINNGTDMDYIYSFRGTIGESWCNELINKHPYDCWYDSGICGCDD